MASDASKRPNFLIIVAVDLGFSDCACFGSEFRTLNIDRHGNKSGRYTAFHSAATCSLTRAMMTGTDHRIAGLGNLKEWTDRLFRAEISEEFQDKVATLPKSLKDTRYHTVISGMWHTGLKLERSPHFRGVERSLAILPACSNHYAYEPLEKGQPRSLEMSTIALHMEDDHYVTELPNDWYSSNGYGDRMLQSLSQWKERGNDRPVFAYYPFPAPHWPLQAWKAHVDHYQGMHDDGPKALRQKPHATLVKLGMIDADTKPHPIELGKSDYFTLKN